MGINDSKWIDEDASLRTRIQDHVGLRTSDMVDAMSYMAQHFRTMGNLFDSGGVSIPENPVLSSAIHDMTQKKIKENSEAVAEKKTGKSRYEILLEDTEEGCSDQS